jgi:hypothetical protein
MDAEEPAYVVYIDEAGDPGIKTKVNTADQALEWFTLGAVVVDIRRDPDVVDWLRDMREAVRAQSLLSPLHYRKLSQSNQRRVCRMLSTKPVRLFAVASHKTNMRGYQNRRMGKPLGKGEFYNWCIRLILERVSDWCARRSKKDHGVVKPIKIIFSERGGHDYDHLFSYLEILNQQTAHGGLVLQARHIVPGTVLRDLCSVKPHHAVAGLQLADITASAFFQAANTGSTTHDLEPAESLKARVAREERRQDAADFGLTVWPRPTQAPIPKCDWPIFERYGYKFKVG